MRAIHPARRISADCRVAKRSRILLCMMLYTAVLMGAVGSRADLEPPPQLPMDLYGIVDDGSESAGLCVEVYPVLDEYLRNVDYAQPATTLINPGDGKCWYQVMVLDRPLDGEGDVLGNGDEVIVFVGGEETMPMATWNSGTVVEHPVQYGSNGIPDGPLPLGSVTALAGLLVLLGSMRLRRGRSAALAVLALGVFLAPGAAADIFNLGVNAGWNLISVPFDLDEPALPDALSSIDGNYASVFAYEGGVWKSYAPDRPAGLNTLAALQLGQGYWLNMTAADTLVFEGGVDCPPGQTDCGGDCTPTDTDPENCGECGNACGLGQACLNGECVDVLEPYECEPGFLDLNGWPGDECEFEVCLLYTSPSPRDRTRSRMPSSA